MRKVYIFLLGGFCFFVSQILIRIPLLSKYVFNTPKGIMFQHKYFLLFGLLVALSAGVFEEGFRFLFRQFLMKGKSSIFEAVLFGLGHSLMEVFYLFMPMWISNGSFIMNEIAAVERILATIGHICFTIIIWEGFANQQKVRYLFVAILLHGLVDFIIPISVIKGFNPYQTEGMFGLLTVVIFVGTVIAIKKGRLQWKRKIY